MIPGSDSIDPDDLQAFVDGRLSAERKAVVEAYLRDNPEAARRAAGYVADRDALRAALAQKANEPIPARLRIAAIVSHRRARRRTRIRLAVAACILLAAGAVLGWIANDLVGPDNVVPGRQAHWRSVAEDAMLAHRTFVAEISHPVEVTGNDDDHLAQWISKRVGQRLPVPNLAPLGFGLMGGRILPSPTGTAAQIMYEEATGLRVTVYVKAGEPGETAMRFIHAQDIKAFYWVDDGCAYVVTGGFDRDRLANIAKQVFRQI